MGKINIIKYHLREFAGHYKYWKAVRRAEYLKRYYNKEIVAFLREDGKVLFTTISVFDKDVCSIVYNTCEPLFYRDLHKRVFIQKCATNNLK